MIRELGITDLGVIERTLLPFGPGLTVLTGETGAGKTLITTAVSQLLGAKGDPGLVRHGASDAVIDCTLDLRGHTALLPVLEDLGAALEDDEVHVTRTIGARSKSSIGSRPVASAVLAEVVGSVITLHGQHGQTRLMRAPEQRTLLDAADTACTQMLPIVREAWANLRDARAAHAAALADASRAVQDLTGLQALVEDVESVAPADGEDLALDARITTLTALDAVQRATRTTVALLTEGDDGDVTDVMTLLARARRLLEQRTEAPEFADWVGRIIEVQELVQGLGHDIGRFADALDAEPETLDALLQRRAALGALLRRWNMDLPGLQQRYLEASRAIALAHDPEEQLQRLAALEHHCAAELETVCASLHLARSHAAGRLGAAVRAELHALGLPHAEFTISVRRAMAPTQFGDDDVEFRFTANPGQPAQALAAVGSGGELSRVMLALETTTAGEGAGTLIFDEVDAGVGGRAALEVGQRLARLAQQHQVIVVTHLAQVAAFADAHVVIEKHVASGTTRTTARLLGDDERPRELARMLSGFEESTTATAHAEELLATAAQARERR